MSTVEESIEVAVPVTTAYNQWTQFESFPQFMEGVERIEQTSDTMTHWVTKVAGVEREFDAMITEQHPDERVAWSSVDEPKQAGVRTVFLMESCCLGSDISRCGPASARWQLSRSGRCTRPRCCRR